MTTAPVTITLIAAAAPGRVLGSNYLRHIGDKPVPIGIRLLPGAGGPEQPAVRPRDQPSGSLGIQATGLLAFTLALGFVASLLAGQSPRKEGYLVAVHAAPGLAGFVFFGVAVDGLAERRG